MPMLSPKDTFANKRPISKEQEHYDKIIIAIVFAFTIGVFVYWGWVIWLTHKTAKRSESVWTTYEISDLKSIQEGSMYSRNARIHYIAYLTAEDGSTYTTYIPTELYTAHHVGESVDIEYYTLTLFTGKVKEYRTWDGYYLHGLPYSLEGEV